MESNSIQTTHNFALIKPASSSCNLCCSYCFYKDVAQNRAVYAHKYMHFDTLKDLVTQYTNTATQSSSFMFQGGEPLLVGPTFYQQYNDLVKDITTKKKKQNNSFTINSSIQTSGFLLTEEFAKIFSEGNFLVGISLDGPEDIHDKYRVQKNGQGTFNRVMQACEYLRQYRVDFNILCVVTKDSVNKASYLLDFYRKHNFNNLQFIPAISPFDEHSIYLTSEDYVKFYIDTFLYWFDCLQKGEFIHIRHIEDLFANILFNQCPSCDMQGHCSIQNVVEANGSIYPCDFYVLDEFKLGTIENGVVNLNKDIIDNFLNHNTLNKLCSTCPWFKACRGGCKRTRDKNDLAFLCKSYQELFKNHFDKIEYVIKNRLLFR